MKSKLSKRRRLWVWAGGLVAVLMLAQEARSQEKRFLVWQQQDLWGLFTPDLLPPPGGNGERIRAKACINEYASALLLVAAPGSGEKSTLRVQVNDLSNGKHILPASQVRVRELTLAKESWDDRVVADPLLERETFVISPRQTKAVWLTIHTRGAEAGEYQGTVLLIDRQGNRQSVRLELTIWPVALPSELPIPFLAFEDDDNPGFRSHLETYVRDLTEHYVNTFALRNCAFPQLDGKRKPIKLLRDPEYVDQKLRLVVKHVQKPKILAAFVEPNIGRSAGWEQTYRSWLGEILAHLGQVGLGYDDFFVGYVDEFSGWATDAYEKAGPALRQIDPRVRIYGGLSDSTPIADARRVASYADLWDFPKGAKREVLAFLKSTGKPIWSDGPYLNHAALDQPYLSLRLTPWRVWEHDFQGADFFTYNRQADFDFSTDMPVLVRAKIDRADKAAIIYPTRDGLVGSRRWEAFRAGWADYLCLHLLREELQRAKQTGPDNRISHAQALIQEAVHKVLANPKDTGLAEQYKERLVSEIVSLRQKE